MDTRERIDWLKSLVLFHDLPEAKLEELTRFLAVEAVPAGSVVFEEGSAGDTMFFLAEGQIRIEKKVEAGGFKELALLSPGDFFGEMALIEETPRSARAVAPTDATLFVLGRSDLAQWLESDSLMAVGFFVELLRVLSHRLRRTSEHFVLLHDLSHLTLQEFEDEADFLRAVLRRMLPHLVGDWSCAAYHYNAYNEELSRVGTEGPRGETLPETLPLTDATNRWLDATSFCVVLPGKTGVPLGFLVARSEIVMSPRERAEFEVALTAAAHLLSSALQNIQHETEQRLRARLEQQKTYASRF